MCQEFFSKHDLEIQIFESVYTDGAPAVLGNFYFILLNQDNPHLQGTHCFLYRHDLISKTLPSKLKNDIDSSVKTIKWINVVL